MEFEIPSVSSLENDIAAKEELKYNPELERMVCYLTLCFNIFLRRENGLKTLLKTSFRVLHLQNRSNPAFFYASTYLHISSILMSRLINKIKPNTISKINASNIAYQQMVP